jgi:antitoxin component YwqK of YwqJK toxin-antitoxin module
MYLGAATSEQSADDFWSVRLAKFSTEGKDLRHGVAKVWYPNGRIEQEGMYQFGEKSGLFTYWHENGQVAATGEFRDDQPDGTWVWWHENGQKLAYGRYEHGTLMGEWRWWNEAGKLTKQHTYDGTESAATQTESTYDVSAQPQELESETSIF